MATNTHDHHAPVLRAGSCCGPANDSGCCAGRKSAPDAAVDPVCGMEVDRRGPNGGSFDLEGTTYYFCSTFCRAKFAATAANEH